MELCFTLSRSQARFRKHPARFKAFIGGVGSGKSYAGAIELLDKGISIQCTAYGIAPTYRMLLDSTIPTFYKVAGDLARPLRKSDMTTELVNGTLVRWRSGENPDHIRGPESNIAWLDEASYMTDYIHPVILGRMRQSVKDKRGVTRLPGMWITCTPKGRNWVYEEWVNRHGTDPDYVVIHTTTYENRRNLAPGYIDALEKSYTGKFFAQEVRGEFVTYEGLVYDGFDEHIHIWSDNLLGPLPDFISFEYGLDYGYAAPAAITVHGIPYHPWEEDRKCDVQVQELYKTRLLYDDLVKAVKQFYKDFMPGPVWCDPSRPELIRDLINAKIDARAGINDILPGIQLEQAGLIIGQSGRPASYITHNCLHTRAEFASYCWKTKGRGPSAIFLDEPDKAAGNDHLMDGRRYRRMGSTKSKHRGVAVARSVWSPR